MPLIIDSDCDPEEINDALDNHAKPAMERLTAQFGAFTTQQLYSALYNEGMETDAGLLRALVLIEGMGVKTVWTKE